MATRMSAAALTAVLVIGGGGVAFAYFTSTGVGTGSATIGSTGDGDIVITSTGPTDSLYPGADPTGFTIQAQNTGTGDEHVDDVTVTVASDDVGNALDTSGVAIIGCLASWFDVGEPIVIDATLTPGSFSDNVSASISLTDSGTDQDACQGAAVQLLYTTSAPV